MPSILAVYKLHLHKHVTTFQAIYAIRQSILTYAYFFCRTRIIRILSAEKIRYNIKGTLKILRFDVGPGSYSVLK